MTWLTAITQMGSVICKSFRLVDLTTGRAGFLMPQWGFLMCLNSDGARSVIYYIYIYNFFSPGIKGLFILSSEHLKKEFCLGMGWNCVIIQVSDYVLDLPYFSHQTKYIKFSGIHEISSSLLELAS